MVSRAERPASAYGFVVGDLGGEEDVVPAAHEARWRDAVKVAAEVRDVPPLVARLAVREPVLVCRDRFADRLGVGLAQGQDSGRPCHHLGTADLRPEHGAETEFLVLELVRPAQRHLEGERPAGVDEGVPGVRRRDVERHGLEELGRVGGDRPLRHAEVAGAPGHETTVEPGLTRHPVQRGVAVGLLVSERLPGHRPTRKCLGSSGSRSDSHARQRAARAVPMMRRPYGVRINKVGRSPEGSRGEPSVRQQRDPVRRLGHEVAFDARVVVSGRRQLQEPGRPAG